MRPLEECRARAARLKLMVFDVDGVLTDGSLYFTDAGTEIKAFNTRDGQGMRMLQNAGVTLAIITGRDAACVTWRMKNLGIEHVYQGVGHKLTTFHSLLAKVGVQAHEAGFMGDDWPDLAVMRRAAFACAPPQAQAEVRAVAHHVTAAAGGAGAARELCDLLLVASGRYAGLLAAHGA